MQNANQSTSSVKVARYSIQNAYQLIFAGGQVYCARQLRFISLASLVLTFLAGQASAVNVQVNTDTPGSVQNEVSLTLGSAGNVLIAHNDFEAGTGIGIGVSNDGGATWNHSHLGIPNHPIVGSPDDGMQLTDVFDPISGADTAGRLFAGYIATDSSGGGRPGGLFVQRSLDNGVTFQPPATVDFNLRATPPLGPDPNYRFADKPHLEVDRNSGGMFQDNVYVAFIQDVDVGQPTSDILFSRSIDNGVSFSVTPTKISDLPTGGFGGGEGNGPNIAVAPNGDVYVAWIDVDVTNPAAKQGTLFVDKSIDGGVTFDALGGDITARQIRSLPNNLTTAAAATDVRARSFPAIATNPNNANELYMVYAEDPDFVMGVSDGPDEADVFFLKSIDGGATWSNNRLRINDDMATTDQFEPWIAVKPDGTIDVVWYDKRNDPVNDALWDVYMATSLDGGSTFLPNVRVSDNSFAAPSLSPTPWIGEYLGLAVDSTDAYIGFTSAFGDSGGDILFQRLTNPTGTAIPEPSTFALGILGLLSLSITGTRRRHR